MTAGDAGPRPGPGLGRAAGAGVLLVLATALVSGVSTFVNVYAVRGTSSDAFVTVRNLAVVALLVPLVAFTYRPAGHRPGPRRQDLVALAGVGLIGGAVPFLLFFHGLELAAAAHGATTASFVYRTLFVFATVLGVVLLRERIRLRYLVGGALLLGGSYLLLTWTPAALTDGAVWVLAATVLWAAEYAWSKRLLAHLPSATVAAGRMGFGGAFLAVYLALTAQWSTVARFSSSDWAWVAISAVLLTAFVATWYAGLARVDLGVATSVLVLGYPVTWLLSTALGGAALSLSEAAGAIAVFAGAGLVVGLARARESWSWLLRSAGRGRTSS